MWQPPYSGKVASKAALTVELVPLRPAHRVSTAARLRLSRLGSTSVLNRTFGPPSVQIADNNPKGENPYEVEQGGDEEVMQGIARSRKELPRHSYDVQSLNSYFFTVVLASFESFIVAARVASSVIAAISASSAFFLFERAFNSVLPSIFLRRVYTFPTIPGRDTPLRADC